MIRRSPTRIELKLDDLQEYEVMRREQEGSTRDQPSAKPDSNDTWLESVDKKTKQEIINERIGYVPQPRPT